MDMDRHGMDKHVGRETGIYADRKIPAGRKIHRQKDR